MSQDKQGRPGHATLAGGLIIGCSIILVLSAWERVSSLHTLETRESFEGMLSDPFFTNLDLSVDTLATVVRVLCLVGAGAATASAILGFQVFKRSTSARIALTALAPFLVAGGFAVPGLFGPLLVAGIAMLWVQPTRDWYAGRPWMQRHEERRAQRLAMARNTVQPDGQVGQAGPAAPAPAGSEPARWPSPGGTDVGGVPGQRPERPQPLVMACVLTWVLSGLSIIALGVVAAMLPSQSEAIYDDFVRQQPQLAADAGLTESGLMSMMYLLVAGFVVWAIVAIVLAVLAYRGQNWARITLLVSALGAGGLALVMSLGAWPLVVAVFGIAVTGWLLLRPEVNAFYLRR